MHIVERTVNPRKQGDAGLGIAIGWFSTHGYTVSIPLTDSQDYDLVVDDGTLQRVQVRTTTSKSEYGVYEVGLRVAGGNRSGTGKRKHFDTSVIDLLFVTTEVGTLYLLPSEVITCRSSLSLGRKYEQYKV